MTVLMIKKGAADNENLTMEYLVPYKAPARASLPYKTTFLYLREGERFFIIS